MIQREVRIRARPETVFAFFVDPARMVQWKGVDAHLDPRPGGLYRVNVTGRDIARGEYVEVTPPGRIVFTWGWEGQDSPVPPGSSTVEVTLVPDGEDTIVRLRHYGLPAGESLEGHLQGWMHYLGRLEAVVAGRDPGPDPWAVAAPLPPQATGEGEGMAPRQDAGTSGRRCARAGVAGRRVC